MARQRDRLADGDGRPAQGRTRRPRVARGEGREALYRALVRVVARDGFDGVTFRSVAAEAGVTHGLASYHFGTREAMINEALSWAVGHSIEAAHLIADGTGVESFATDVPAMVSQSPEEAVFQYDLLLRALRSPALRIEVRKSYDAYVAAVEQSLTLLGIENAALARLVFAALDGLTLQQLLYDDPPRTAEAIKALHDLLRLASTRDDHEVAAAARA